MDIQNFGVTKISQEFRGAILPDARLKKRLVSIVERLEEDPSSSFPTLFASGAELEGFYRFVRNPSIDASDLFEAHCDETLQRAEQAGLVLALHDTSEFSFQGERAKLGLTSTNARGFYFHASLLVSASRENTPLGIAQTRCHTRTKVKHHRTRKQREADPENEGKRWLDSIQKVEENSKGRFECIHVADREADAYDLLSSLRQTQKRFVIRARSNRLIVQDGERVHIREALQTLRPRVRRKIALTTRTVSKYRSDRRRSVRPGRQTTLAISSTTVAIASPAARPGKEMLGEMNVVRVWEENPPLGEKPIEWILWTSEPIASVEELETIVDYYRARWVIEEYFKALKTGCQMEKRQLETMTTMRVALALFVPIAWKMLLARTLAHGRPNASAYEIVTGIQKAYLEKKYGCSIGSAQEAFLRIAQLGGHLSQNGDPGWLTLGRGFEKLRQLDEFLAVMSP